MRPPPGVAKFDSATAMAIALARFLEGRDFPGLGQSRLLQFLVRGADWVPRRLRERIFARLGAREGVEPQNVGEVYAADVAEWIRRAYPRRRYPAVMIGSSSGAFTHVAAALGIPWLPQTFLTLVRVPELHPDDAVAAMQSQRRNAERFLAANPGSQLHHMHDPSQDRLMAPLVAYFRSKFRRLPEAYLLLLESSLEPGGTLMTIECGRTWPTTRLGEHYVYQFGAVGGPTTQEYFCGGERVADYLARYGSSWRRWEPPAADSESPEAEWGFEPVLREELESLARRRGYRILRVAFDDPEAPSPLVAEFYRAWNRERGVQGERLVIESFILLEPHWVLRTGSVPYWMVFNMQPSLDNVHRYLDRAAPYDEIYLMLFAHGVDSVGLPPIDGWRSLLARARTRGEFLGLHPDTYPAHFAAFARYSQALRRVPPRYPLPAPLPLARVERFLREYGPAAGVRVEEG